MTLGRNPCCSSISAALAASPQINSAFSMPLTCAFFLALSTAASITSTPINFFA